MKWHLILIMALMMIPIATAQLTECTGVMEPSDMPCQIISTWQFPETCNTHTIMIYNKTPSLIRTATMGDYTGETATGRCNITFGINSNETKTGSYLLNWSSGDSSKIIVEANEMSFIAIAILLGIITFVFAYMTTKVKHWAAQLALSLFTMIMIFFDFFISARVIEIVDSAQTGMIYYLDTFFKIGVTLFRFLLAVTIIYLFYYTWKVAVTWPMRKRNKRDEEGFYG